MDQQATVQMLIWELDCWFQELVKKLSEISKEESKWKPTIHSKTLDTLRQWNEKGEEWISVQHLDPISTIEFKVVHLAQCKQMYDEYAFREGSLNWVDLECPEWPHCNDYMKQTQKSLVESLQNLTDQQLDDRVLTNWGELWSIKRIISPSAF